MGPDRRNRDPARVEAESKVAEAGAAVTALDRAAPVFVQAVEKKQGISPELPVLRLNARSAEQQ
jgi:hypothetical protein